MLNKQATSTIYLVHKRFIISRLVDLEQLFLVLTQHKISAVISSFLMVKYALERYDSIEATINYSPVGFVRICKAITILS